MRHFFHPSTNTLIESQDEFSDFGLLSVDSIETFDVQTRGLHKLQALVHYDGDIATGQDLLLQRNSRHLGVAKSRHPQLRLC